MKIIDAHRPGDFCWVELGTTDQDGAKAFYTSLLGWQATDHPMGPDGVYTMLRIDGNDAAALYGLNPEQRAQGIPAHWMLYVAVPSADAAASKAEANGGKLVMRPFDVMDLGRMAIFQDPGGAVLSVWEAKKHTGIRIAGAPGAFCWGELMTRDTEQAAKFYAAVFGWGVKPSPEYTEWTNEGISIGGMMKIRPEWGGAPPYWGPYFQVENCDASVAKAASAGGQIHKPGTDIEHVGRFAVIGDPQGAAFSIIQLLPAAH